MHSLQVQITHCMNYECNNALTSYELEKIKNGKTYSYFGIHFCRSCRSRLTHLTRFKCIKCGKPFSSTITGKYYCADCSSHKHRGLRYCRICSERVPFGKKQYCSKECYKEGNRRNQKRWRENHK